MKEGFSLTVDLPVGSQGVEDSGGFAENDSAKPL